MSQDKRELLCEMGYDDAIVYDNPDYDDAIIGVTDDGQVVYDYDLMIACLGRSQGWTAEEAADFISYNTMNVHSEDGPNPIIMNRLPE